MRILFTCLLFFIIGSTISFSQSLDDILNELGANDIDLEVKMTIDASSTKANITVKNVGKSSSEPCFLELRKSGSENELGDLIKKVNVKGLSPSQSDNLTETINIPIGTFVVCMLVCDDSDPSNNIAFQKVTTSNTGGNNNGNSNSTSNCISPDPNYPWTNCVTLVGNNNCPDVKVKIYYPSEIDKNTKAFLPVSIEGSQNKLKLDWSHQISSINLQELTGPISRINCSVGSSPEQIEINNFIVSGGCQAIKGAKFTINIKSTSPGPTGNNCQPYDYILGLSKGTILEGEGINLKMTINGGISPYKVTFESKDLISGEVKQFVENVDSKNWISLSQYPKAKTAYKVLSIIDDKNCKSLSGNGVIVEVNKKPVNPCNTMSIDFSGDKQITAGDQAKINFVVVGGTPPYKLKYSEGVFDLNDNNSQIILRPIKTTEYKLLEITDSKNCTTKLGKSLWIDVINKNVPPPPPPPSQPNLSLIKCNIIDDNPEYKSGSAVNIELQIESQSPNKENLNIDYQINEAVSNKLVYNSYKNLDFISHKSTIYKSLKVDIPTSISKGEYNLVLKLTKIVGEVYLVDNSCSIPIKISQGQRPDSPTSEKNISIYDNTNYKGRSLKIGIGCTNESSLVKNGISNIRSVNFDDNEYKVTIYTGDNCNDINKELKTSISNINLNVIRGLATSIKVEKLNDQSNVIGDTVSSSNGGLKPLVNGLTIFDKVGYSGKSVIKAKEGCYDLDDLKSNNLYRINSLDFDPSDCNVTIYSGENCTGPSRKLDEKVSNFLNISWLATVHSVRLSK